jgi:hypothetical protein
VHMKYLLPSVPDCSFPSIPGFWPPERISWVGATRCYMLVGAGWNIPTYTILLKVLLKSSDRGATEDTFPQGIVTKIALFLYFPWSPTGSGILKPVPEFKPTMCLTSSVKQLFAYDGAETHRFVVA